MSKLKERFSRMRMMDGYPETISGSGSTMAYTEGLRPKLKALFKKEGYKSVLDAPCGDFNWMQHVIDDTIDYVGVDIVDKIIEDNTQKYGNAKRKFMSLDAASEDLPRADLMICRDLLLHLDFLHIQKVLENFLKSGIEHLLVSSYRNGFNRDLPPHGSARAVNLNILPFRLPKPDPVHTFPDWVEGQMKRDLILYHRNDLVGPVRQSGRVINWFLRASAEATGKG